MSTHEHQHDAHITIHINIDNLQYEVHHQSMTGGQLRKLPGSEIGHDQDLLKGTRQAPMDKISDEEIVELENGMHFFFQSRQIQIKVQIDRIHYTVEKLEMTGAELRMIPSPVIGQDRDLFEIVPGAPDRKVLDSDSVELHNGKRFFTAPGQINPG